MLLALKYLSILLSFSWTAYFLTNPFCVTSRTQYLPNKPLLLCSFLSSSPPSSKQSKLGSPLFILTFQPISRHSILFSSLLTLLLFKLFLASPSSYHALFFFSYSLGLFNKFCLPVPHLHLSSLHFGLYYFASLLPSSTASNFLMVTLKLLNLYQT